MIEHPLNHETPEPTKKLEIERRWLVKLPLSATAHQMITDDPDAPARITQTYLKSSDGTVKRLRYVEIDMWGVPFTHFIRTEKKLVSMGVNEESEQTLTELEYQSELLGHDPRRNTLDKTRYHIHYDGRLLELDVFHGEHEGLAILEAELNSIDETVILPSFLDIEREITFESGWSNFDLAAKRRSDGWFDKLVGWFRPKERSFIGM